MVLGCGAVGSFFASSLSRVCRVYAYDVEPGISSAAARHGVRIFRDAKAWRTARFPVVSTFKDLKDRYYELVILATKAYDTERAAKALSCLAGFGCVLTVQNGLDNPKIVARHAGASAVLCGVTTLAAQNLGPAKTNIFYDGLLYLAPFKGSGADARAAERFFSAAGMAVRLCRDWEGMLWSKLIFNAVMNPLPLLVADGYAMMSQHPGVVSIVHRAIGEAKAVARKLGIRLVFDPEKIISKIEKGALKGLEHKGSMFDDIAAGKKSEIDLLTGVVLKKARAVGVDTPVLGTLYSLVKAIEAKQRKR